MTVSEILPIKQGLKHRGLRKGMIGYEIVSEILPIKQGLKPHFPLPFSATRIGSQRYFQ